MNRIVTRKRSLLQATSNDDPNMMGDPSLVQAVSDDEIMNQSSSNNGHIISTSELSPKKVAVCYDSDSGYSMQRAGKWSADEENLANQLVTDFENGALEDCEDGTTLRSYLARKLNCAPMRISKKFAGRCIGKLSFIRREGATSLSKEHSVLLVASQSGATRAGIRRAQRNRLYKGQAKGRRNGASLYMQAKSPTSSESSGSTYGQSQTSLASSSNDDASISEGADDSEPSDSSSDFDEIEAFGLPQNRSFILAFPGGGLSSSCSLKNMGEFGHGNISTSFLDEYHGFLEEAADSEEQTAPECDPTLMLLTEPVHTGAPKSEAGATGMEVKIASSGQAEADAATDADPVTFVPFTPSRGSVAVVPVIVGSDTAGEDDWGDVFTLLCEGDEAGYSGGLRRQQHSCTSLSQMCN